jgi:hypothetical protein
MGSYAQHQAACLGLGGDLVAYLSSEVQQQVERYFLKQTPLYSYWWVAGPGPGCQACVHDLVHAAWVC